MYLTGQLLIAMPTMPDPRFERTVIYMCTHSEDGAMGLVVNKRLESISFTELVEQLEITVELTATEHYQVLSGGPVDAGRGFVLHSDDFFRDGTRPVQDGVALTWTIDILRAIADGHGPKQYLLALGYTGWGPGQLDAEIQANGWLHAPADDALLFDTDLDGKWERAIAKIGVSPSMLSGESGHA